MVGVSVSNAFEIRRKIEIEIQGRKEGREEGREGIISTTRKDG